MIVTTTGKVFFIVSLYYVTVCTSPFCMDFKQFVCRVIVWADDSTGVTVDFTDLKGLVRQGSVWGNVCLNFS